MATLDQRPKHKPSPKHTLDEVLKSLQDLIRNDLIDSGAAAGDDPAARKKTDHQHKKSRKPKGDVQGGTSPGLRGTRDLTEESAPGPRETSTSPGNSVRGQTDSGTRSVAGRAARARSNDTSSTVDNVLDSLRELIVKELAEAQSATSTEALQKSASISQSDGAPPNAEHEIHPRAHTDAAKIAPKAAKRAAVAARETHGQEKNSPVRPESPRADQRRDDQAEFSFRDVHGRTSAGARGSAFGPRGTSVRTEGNDASTPKSERPVRSRQSEKGEPPAAVQRTVAEATDGFDYEYIDLDAPAESDPESSQNLDARAHDIRSGFEELVAPPLPNDVEIESKRGGAAKKTAKTLEVAEWDDIPVLDEVAAHPDDALTGHKLDVSQSAPSTGAPKPDRFREIAVKVVAKLNIELRKCGERGLEPRTVDRLHFLLREALGTPKTNQSGKRKR